MTSVTASENKRIVDFRRTLYVQTEDCLQEGEHHYIVMRHAGVFECVEAMQAGGRAAPVDAKPEDNWWVGWTRYNSYEWFQAYIPIHPDMTLADVEGTSIAIDDGKYWQFAHAEPQQHHEMALMLEALTLAAFQPQVENALLARLGATDSDGIASTGATLTRLYEFRNDVFKSARTNLYSKYQGYYHQNRQISHFRDLIVQAIGNVKNIWSGVSTKQAGLAAITRSIASVEHDLVISHTVNTKAEQLAAVRAREAAAKKAAEEEETE